MNSILPIAGEPGAAGSRHYAELFRCNELLTKEIQELRAANFELTCQLSGAMLGRQVERDFRLAALNLMEDADHARTQSLAVNTRLKELITEHLQAEKDLDESQFRLQTAQNSLHQLSTEFETRVDARTQELRARELRMGELAIDLKRTEQKERQDLARLLHDHIQQLLIAARMRADLLATELEGDQYQTQMAVISILGDAINAARNLSVQLSPPLLHDQGLPAALGWLASRMMDQHGVTVETQIDEAANPAVEEHRDILFQAAQEFLLNAVKHAGVTQTQLKLNCTTTQVQLQVCDRGAGFDPAKAENAHGSFGLLQLRQRLSSVGGQLDIETMIGQGTNATAIVPSANESARAQDPQTAG